MTFKKSLYNKIHYLLALLLLSFLTPTVAQTPEVSLTDVETDPGIIEVPVEMNNFTDQVNSFTFQFYLDTLSLNFIEVTDVVGFSSGNITAYQNGSFLNINWFNMNGYQPDGFVFNLKLDFSGNANTFIDFVEQECEVTYGLDPIPNIEYISAFIFTTEDLPAPTVKLSSFDTIPGNVSNPVEMLYFDSLINEFHLFIEIENASLSFIDISDLAYPLSYEELEVVQNGNIISISWQASGEGFFPQNKIFDLELNYFGGFENQLIWQEESQVVSGGLPIENISFENGIIGQSFTSNQVSLDNVSAQPFSEFSVPLNFEGGDFTYTNEFNFSIAYNSEQIDYMGITSQIGDITVTENENELVLNWSGDPQDFSQENVANLEFYYNSEDNSTIAFEPGSYVNTENLSIVPTNYSNCDISAIIPQDTIKIVSDSMFNNQSVTLPISTTSIEDLNELQLSIALASNIELTNWSPVQLDGWEFTENGSEIIFSYNGDAPVNVVEGNLLLLEFFFSSGNSASLSFSDDSFVISNDNEAIVSYIDGNISKASNNAQAVIENITECNNNTATVPVNLYAADPFKEIYFRFDFNDGAVQFSQFVNVNDQLENHTIEQGDGYVIFHWDSEEETEIDGLLFELEFETAGAYSAISFADGSQLFENGGSSIPVHLIDGEIDCDEIYSTLTTNVSGEGNIIVSNDGSVIEPDEGSTNQYTVEQGTVLSLEAISAEGYGFLYWEESDNTIYDNPYEITINENRQVTAYFAANEYQLTLTDNPDNGGNSFGDGIYLFEDAVTVEAYAFSGWSFNSWTNGDGQTLSENPTYSFQMPATDLVLHANYEKNYYSLELTAIPSGGGSVLGSGTYQYNEEVTIEAIPNNGYSFINWTTESGIVISDDPLHTFNMPYNNILYAANFDSDVSDNHINKYDIEIYPNPANNDLFIKYGKHFDEFDEILIKNISGQVLKSVDAFTRKKTNDLLIIDVSKLNPGLYIIEINQAGNSVYKKVLIQ